MSEFINDKSLVEILPNGDMLYCGRKLSTIEFDVGNVLCDLGNSKSSQVCSDNSLSDDFDDTMSEISQDSVESMPIPSRPKVVNKRRRKTASSTELPADDVRLTYTKMYFEALNSGDAPTIAAVLHQIAIPKVVLVSKKLTHSPDHHLPNYLEIIGVDAIASVCETFFLATPDVVVQMLSQRIHCFANGESCIECDVVMKGSKMYELTGLQEGTSDKVVLNSVEEVATGLSKVHLATAPPPPPGSGSSGGSTTKKLIASITSANEPQSSSDSESLSSSSVVSKDVPVALGKAHAKKRNICVSLKLTFHLNPDKKVFLMISAKD